MKKRRLILTIDDIIRLFGDYLKEEDLPAGTKAVKLMVRPSDRKLAIVAENPAWGEGLPPIVVSFKLRRVWGGK